MLASRAAELQRALLSYFKSDNLYFKSAYSKTTKLDIFDTSDIQHAVKHYIYRLKNNDLLDWVNQTPTTASFNSARMLYLGAGNIPFVWLQDLCAILISGISCSFKYSSKSPFFIESLFDFFHKYHPSLCSAVNISPDLTHFHEQQHDCFVFTGDTENENKVYDYCSSNNMLVADVKKLIRRAQYSIAYIENPLDTKIATNLVESILRYRNKGCRSVAIVVSPISFKRISCAFTDYIEAYYIHNTPSKKDNALILQKYAYYKALNKAVYWLDQFIVLENDFDTNSHQLISWFEGDLETAKKLYQTNKDKIQAFYSASGSIDGTEDLAIAQTPPLYWKPDGKNFLDFILND